MTGVVNNTGARTGVVGTTVGTPESTNASALSSGTLPAARLPAGTVVQTTFQSYNSADSDTITSGTLTKVETGSNVYNWKGNITITGSNDILITMEFGVWLLKYSTNAAGGALCIFRDVASPASGTSGTKIWETLNIGMFTHVSGVTATFNYHTRQIVTFLDAAPGAGEHYYYLGYAAYDSTTMSVQGASAEEPFTCRLQEIQR